VTISRSTTGHRTVRGLVVGFAVAVLVAVGSAPASAQGLGTDDRSQDAAPAQPGQFTQRSGLLPGRADAAAGAAELREALERDLGVTGAALDELLADAAAATALDAQLKDQLGSAYGGSWFNRSSGSLTVGVTNRGAATLARSAGAQTRLVDRSEQALLGIIDTLDARYQTNPTAMAGLYSWGFDPTTNQVLVTVQTGQTESAAARLAEFGDAVRIEETATAPQLAQQLPFLDGGIAYDSALGGCSTGFNLRDAAGTGFVLTAGHCSNGAAGVGLQTSHAGNAIGPFVSSFSAPFDDALIRNDNPGFWIQGPWVWTYPGFLTVNGSTAAPVGTPVCKSGRTTGFTCGFITLRPDTVLGITDLVRHSACVEQGDSGGSNLNIAGGIFAEGVSSAAQLASDGTRLRCLQVFGLPNVSWYYPISLSLPFFNAVFGVNLLTG
jgi:streptogrisin C